MNACDYINSRDVRDYVGSIGYRFSAPEAAFLVWNSDGRTLEEKIEAWEEIVATMPDCPMGERNWFEATDSFHSRLSDYVALQRRMAESFPTPDGRVYSYSAHEAGHGWRDGEGFFSDYGSCAALCREHELPDEDVDLVRIHRSRLDPAGDGPDAVRHGSYVELSKQGEVLEVVDRLVYEEDARAMELDCMFEGMCFDLPTPFRRGDILAACGGRGAGGPFVLSRMSTWDSAEMLGRGFHPDECPRDDGWERFDEHTGLLLGAGDLTDMYAIGTCCHEGDLCGDAVMAVPTDLEYYRGELRGYDRQLRPLSLHERGEIGSTLLVNSCFSIRSEEMARRARAPYAEQFLAKFGLAGAGGGLGMGTA